MTPHHKKQIDMALRLYQDRGEFDGHSIAQAREVLTRAGYEWKRDLADYVKKKLKGGQRIVGARVTTYPDSGQTKVWIDWSDGSSTSGSPNSVHMEELIRRARREGVKVKFGLFGEER